MYYVVSNSSPYSRHEMNGRRIIKEWLELLRHSRDRPEVAIGPANAWNGSGLPHALQIRRSTFGREINQKSVPVYLSHQVPRIATSIRGTARSSISAADLDLAARTRDHLDVATTIDVIGVCVKSREIGGQWWGRREDGRNGGICGSNPTCGVLKGSDKEAADSKYLDHFHCARGTGKHQARGNITFIQATGKHISFHIIGVFYSQHGFLISSVKGSVLRRHGRVVYVLLCRQSFAPCSVW